MNAADLISAKMNGVDFERLYGAVKEGRESVSSLPSDQLDFLESMLEEVRKATSEFESAVKEDNVPRIKELAVSFQEIFQMVSDSCDDG